MYPMVCIIYPLNNWGQIKSVTLRQMAVEICAILPLCMDQGHVLYVLCDNAVPFKTGVFLFSPLGPQ